jgi:hypothetical protein
VTNFPVPSNNNDGRGVVFVIFYYPFDSTGNTIIVGVDDTQASLYKVQKGEEGRVKGEEEGGEGHGGGEGGGGGKEREGE